ncbi:sterol desaturase family protein [uncultured Algimonas sp.]|uniref:sterol desaturase family protein n=1 Tax=uncultured Algimonas sp. TaxID=1547920 RepID=UPI00260EC78C|nr:sterol desaturase family protein [uncultured Algimonas sp.]
METAGLIRLGAFIGVLLLFTALECVVPARTRVLPRLARWRTNLSLSVLGTVVSALMAPVLAVSVAAAASAQGWGLFNVLSFDPWMEGALAVVLLDFAVWAQHVAFHHVPWLWRLHSVHHTDRDLDATTGVRFHPVEIGISLLWKALVILALGPSVLAVIAFEVVLNATSIFTHSNTALPRRLDRALRRLIVTPAMHRIHHSVRHTETDSNYGFNLSVWDRLFGTYRGQAAMPLTLGLSDHQTERPARLVASLVLPFARRKP